MSDAGSQTFFSYTFHYRPNIASAALDIGLFSAATIVLLLLTLRYGGRYMYVIVATGFVEALAYGLRLLTTIQPSLGPFITSTLLLLVAPVALAFVNYLVVAELLRAAGKPIWILQPRHIARIFLTSDIVCFFVQAGGGGLLAVGTDQMNQIATALVMTGLAVQIVFFSGFAYITYIIATEPRFQLKFVPALKPVFHGLSLTMAMLYIRNIYRIVEFSSGVSGFVSTHEWVFNVFETLPIFAALVLYAVFHFGQLLEVKEMEKALWLQQLSEVRIEQEQQVNGNVSVAMN